MLRKAHVENGPPTRNGLDRRTIFRTIDRLVADGVVRVLEVEFPDPFRRAEEPHSGPAGTMEKALVSAHFGGGRSDEELVSGLIARYVTEKRGSLASLSAHGSRVRSEEAEEEEVDEEGETRSAPRPARKRKFPDEQPVGDSDQLLDAENGRRYVVCPLGV